MEKGVRVNLTDSEGAFVFECIVTRVLPSGFIRVLTDPDTRSTIDIGPDGWSQYRVLRIATDKEVQDARAYHPWPEPKPSSRTTRPPDIVGDDPPHFARK